MNILVVDDSATTRQFIKRAVDLLGFNFLEAADGQEALSIVECKNGQIDLILLDLYMPVMDGFEMLETLKSVESYKHIPISMVTAETEKKDIHKAIDLGASNYLVKPFTKVDLVSKIMEGLGQEM